MLTSISSPACSPRRRKRCWRWRRVRTAPGSHTAPGNVPHSSSHTLSRVLPQFSSVQRPNSNRSRTETDDEASGLVFYNKSSWYASDNKPATYLLSKAGDRGDNLNNQYTISTNTDWVFIQLHYLLQNLIFRSDATTCYLFFWKNRKFLCFCTVMWQRRKTTWKPKNRKYIKHYAESTILKRNSLHLMFLYYYWIKNRQFSSLPF